MVRVVGYCRVSSVNQVDNFSITSQKNAIQEYCIRNGEQLIDFYIDNAISGATIERPALLQLREDMHTNKFDKVVVWSITRLSRNTSDMLNIISEFESCGIEFYSISDNLGDTTASGKLLMNIFGSLGEYERAMLIENVKSGLNQRAKSGLHTGAPVLGYDRSSDKTRELIINEAEASIVREIYNRYASGQGYRAIANALNRSGFTTKRGNPFGIPAVKYILTNDLYVGNITYGRYLNWNKTRRRNKNSAPIEVEGAHEAIIDPDLWHRVQSRMKKTQRQPRHYSNNSNLLTGILRCPQCGSSMAISNTTNKLKDGTVKRTRYYSCSQFKNKGASVCRANSIQADVIEKYVFEFINDIVLNPALVDEVVEKVNSERNSQSVEEIKALIDYHQTHYDTVLEKKNNLIDVISSDQSLIEILSDKILELTHELDDIQTHIDKLKTHDIQDEEVLDKHTVRNVLTSIFSDVSHLECPQLKSLYLQTIESIQFKKNTDKTKSFIVNIMLSEDILNTLYNGEEIGEQLLNCSPFNLSSILLPFTFDR